MLLVKRLVQFGYRAATIAWFLMLLLGILHADVSAAVPALGWWTCFAAVLCLMQVLGGLVTDLVTDVLDSANDWEPISE